MKGEVGKMTNKTQNLNHSISKPVLQREKLILVVWPHLAEFGLDLGNSREIINAYFSLPIIEVQLSLYLNKALFSPLPPNHLTSLKPFSCQKTD